MKYELFAHPIFKRQRPWWLPFLSVFVTLYGIFFLNWRLFPIIFLFWWEVILMVASALIRSFFALGGQPFWKLLFQRIFFLVVGGVLGGVMIIFAIIFSLKGMDLENDWGGFEGINMQQNIMTAGFAIGLLVHYFGNGRFRKAQPMGELFPTFAHLMVLLAILQVITMHLIPNYPSLDGAKWVAIAVVAVKLSVDLAFGFFGWWLQKTVAKNQTAEIRNSSY